MPELEKDPACPLCPDHCTPNLKAIVLVEQKGAGRCLTSVHVRDIPAFELAKILGELAVEIADHAVETEVQHSIKRLGEMLGAQPQDDA